MDTLDLPEPIAAYFAADAVDGAAVARCFTSNGVVVDEGRSHLGQAAIEAWKRDTSARYSYTATPLRLDPADGRHIVTSRVAGGFPGSPLELRYVFTLERGRIATLEIAP